MKKQFALTALFALCLLAAAPQAKAQAQIEIGPRVGYEVDDIDALTVGGDVRISTFALPVQINGSADYFFLDDFEEEGISANQSLWKFAVNGLFEFGVDNQLFTPYAGPGISFTRFSTDADVGDFAGLDSDSNTDVGLNAVGGAKFSVGQLRPFVQAELVLVGDREPVQLTGGLLFRIGGN